MEANQAAEAKGAGKMGSQLEALLESKGKGKVKAQAKGGGSRVEASSENASHQASFITPNGGSAHVKVNVADEAPLPETGANGGPNTDQRSELCCGPLEPMKLQRRRFQRLKSRSFLTLTIRMMTMMG